MDKRVSRYTFTLELDEHNLKHICDSLEFYERVIGLGQLDELTQEITMGTTAENLKDFLERRKTADHLIRALKSLFYGLDPNESRGIRSAEVPKKCKEMYDIFQVMRKALAESRLKTADKEGDEINKKHIPYTVHMDSYYGIVSDDPPVVISFKEKEAQ